MKVLSRSAHHNTFAFQIAEHEVVVTSDFDSGNLEHLEFVAPNVLLLAPANDCAGSEYASHSKSWFHFRITGVPLGLTLKLVVRSVHMLASNVKFSEHYRAVYKCKGQDWKRTSKCLVITKDQDTELHIEHRFDKSAETSFAFAYPHSYEQAQHFLHTVLKNEAPNTKDVYFHSEVMITSPQGRNINLITISSQEGREAVRESRITEYLFPMGSHRAHRFRLNKKVVLITARVHPGETPSSHTINGIVKFLLSKDARAEVLRRYFVFMLIPMLNPDGVFHGHYRMDHLNQNLNRFYLNPEPRRHPGPYAVRCLAEHLSAQNRLFFYADLHAHAGKKGNFFYGNALDNFGQQVETQLFAKLLSLNCVNFEYENCNFTLKHMSSKDRNEAMTKEGCGRVVLQKLCQLTYSYTLQCGYHQSAYLNELPVVSNGHRRVKKMGLLTDEYDNIKSQVYAEGPPFFTVESYENVGKSLLITILEVFGKNPYSRIANSQFKNLEALRKDVMAQVGKVERFQSVEKTLIYRAKKLQGSVGGYTPVSEQFESEGVFELRGVSRQQQHDQNRRALVNLSVRAERADRRSNPNRILRVRDYTHPKLYVKKAQLTLKEQGQQ